MPAHSYVWLTTVCDDIMAIIGTAHDLAYLPSRIASARDHAAAWYWLHFVHEQAGSSQLHMTWTPTLEADACITQPQLHDMMT
jgi:hypothetical protein